MSPIMSSQLITKKHYNITWSPPMHSSLHKSFCFRFISYSKVLKLQKWWSWWWRWWLGNNVITPESLSYIALPYILPTVICRSHMRSYFSGIYILVWCIGMGMVYIYWYVQPYYHHPFRGGFWILCFSSVEPSKPRQKRHTRKSKPNQSYRQICKNIFDGYLTFIVWFCCLWW